MRSYAILDSTGKLPTEQIPDDLVSQALIGVPGGIAPLDGSGAVPAAYLAATGTPDGTKFLRDDNSWQPAGGAHPGLAAHDALGLATEAELTSHAATAHGLVSHAIDGAFHSGAAVLPTQGQKNALAGTSGTPGTGNEFVTTQDARNSDARTPLVHAHLDGDIPASIARDSEVASAVATHATTPHGGAGTWTTVIKTADESKNSLAVVANDALLKFTTLPNTNYTIRLRAFFLTNATADLKYRLVHGGTTTRVRRMVKRTATTDIAQTIVLATAFDAADVILSTTGLNPWLEEDVILQVGASGGLFCLQWAQGTSNAGPTTCLEGSYLEYALT